MRMPQVLLLSCRTCDERPQRPGFLGPYKQPAQTPASPRHPSACYGVLCFAVHFHLQPSRMFVIPFFP